LPDDQRQEIPNEGKWKLTRTIPVDGQDLDLKDEETFIQVEAKNTTTSTYYVYGINITENGAIIAFLPPSRFQILTELGPDKKLVFKDCGLLLTDPIEHVRLMAVKQQLDITLLEQTEFQRTRSKGSANPVEMFLHEQLPRTRGVAKVTANSFSPEDWGTVWTSIRRGR
jgi:hypothetical protein